MNKNENNTQDLKDAVKVLPVADIMTGPLEFIAKTLTFSDDLAAWCQSYKRGKYTTVMTESTFRLLIDVHGMEWLKAAQYRKEVIVVTELVDGVVSVPALFMVLDAKTKIVKKFNRVWDRKAGDWGRATGIALQMLPDYTARQQWGGQVVEVPSSPMLFSSAVIYLTDGPAGEAPSGMTRHYNTVSVDSETLEATIIKPAAEAVQEVPAVEEVVVVEDVQEVEEADIDSVLVKSEVVSFWAETVEEVEEVEERQHLAGPAYRAIQSAVPQGGCVVEVTASGWEWLLEKIGEKPGRGYFTEVKKGQNFADVSAYESCKKSLEVVIVEGSAAFIRVPSKNWTLFLGHEEAPVVEEVASAVQPSEDVQTVEAPAATVVIPEPLEEVLEAAEVPAVEDDENIWELLEVEEEEEEEVLTVSETEKLLKAWWKGNRSYYTSRGARALGLNAIYVDYKIDGNRIVLTENGERVHWVTVVADPEPVDPSAPVLQTIEGRAYLVPPMPEHKPELVFTPMADLVQAIFEEAENVHVVPYAADMSVTEKRLKVSKSEAAYVLSVLEGSREWMLNGVNYELGYGMKTKWAEYIRGEFSGSADVIAVEPLRGYVILRGAQAGVFANVPKDYLSDPAALQAVVNWCMDLETVNV